MTGRADRGVIETTLAPNDARESAILASLAPGALHAIVNGAEGSQNIALVEVFDLDANNSPQCSTSRPAVWSTPGKES